MDTQEIAKLIVGPAVVSTFVTLIVTYLKDKTSKKLDLAQSAWEVCRTLEQFTLACSRMIEDVNISIAALNAGQALSAEDANGLPPFAYPSSINWKAFEGHDAYRIRAMETAHDASKRFISLQEDDSDFSYLPSRLEHQCAEAAKLGQNAWKLAEQVRSKYGLPPPKFHPHDKRTLDIFAKELSEFRAREEARTAASAANMLKLEALTREVAPRGALKKTENS